MLRPKFYSLARGVLLSLIYPDPQLVLSEEESLEKAPIFFLEEVESTNDAIKCRLGSGSCFDRNFALVARRQTAGRGRLGHHWQSLDGNLFMSVAIALEAGEEQRIAECSFMAALAVLDVALDYDPRLDVRLKWPNDVLIAGSKVAGLLLEQHETSLIIGIGVNLSVAPELDTGSYTATCLSEHGVSLAPREAAYAVYQRIFARLGEWRQYGFPHILQAWKAYMFGIGSSVRVRFAQGGEQTGTLVSLADDGALVVSVAGTMQRILAGDVLFDPRPSCAES